MEKIRFNRRYLPYSLIFLCMLATHIYPSAILGYVGLAATAGFAIYHMRKPQLLILAQIMYVCQYQFYISQVGLPGYVSYFTDVILLLLLLHLLYAVWIQRHRLQGFEKGICLYIFLFMAIGLWSNISYDSNFILYLWAVRNNIRIPLFCLVSMYFMQDALLRDAYRFLETAYFFNAIFVALQYLVFGYYRDYIGGIFGTQMGVSNTYLHVLLIIIACIVIVRYIRRTMPLSVFLYYMGSMALICAVSELKVMFIEIPVVFATLLLFYNFHAKIMQKLAFISFITILMLYFSLPILEKVSPFFTGFLTAENIFSILSNSYTGGDDIGRFNAISYVREHMFRENNYLTMFGIGLGNAEMSQTFSFLTSTFYRYFGEWTYYHWFSYPFVFIETGLVGVAIYLSLYVGFLWHFLRVRNKTEYACVAFMISVITFFLFVYNLTLRIEAGYLIVFILAAGYRQEA